MGLLTARGADRCLRVAWTVADLVGHDCPSEEDVAVALNFKDRRAA
jgi:magnesium chelatase family protein